jgi:putative ABC transport system permease protein
MALGATPRIVLRLILSESAKVLLLGLGLGIAGALAIGRFLSTLLFGVHPADPWRSPRLTSRYAAPCASIPSSL